MRATVPGANRIGIGMTAIGVVASVAAAITVPIVLLWNADSDAKSTAFTSTPQFLLWMLLLSAQSHRLQVGLHNMCYRALL